MNGVTPWAQWMRIGLGVMGLPPQAFWSMSLREWALALEGLAGARGAVKPLTRSELERLIEEDERAHLSCSGPGEARNPGTSCSIPRG
ncbi:MAG: phage tail assembly chaperone [Alphaproteobacteria bacterium]